VTQQIYLLVPSGRTRRCDISFLADVHYQYAGYIAYRTDPQRSRSWGRGCYSLHRACSIDFPILQILLIPVRHESLNPGLRRFSGFERIEYDQATELPRIPDGKVAEQRDDRFHPDCGSDVEPEMRSYADTVMAPRFKSIWGQLRPFVQAILDLELPQMRFGRWH